MKQEDKKPTKVIVFVRRGVCETVWSTQPIDVEVVDLDGDFRDEGEARLTLLQSNEEDFPMTAEFKQHWP